MPNDLKELAQMIARRDDISYDAALTAIKEAAIEMERAFFTGDLNLAELILKEDLGLEPDYLDLFIF